MILTVFHPLFGMIEIPDTVSGMQEEVKRCRKRFFEKEEFDHCLQAKIDCLESELDILLRGME